MRTPHRHFCTLLFALCLLSVSGLCAAPNEPVTVERGLHRKVVQNDSGATYTILADGLCYEDNGVLKDSEEIFELEPGFAVARRGAHKATLAANINSERVVELIAPDGKRFVSRIAGLSWFSAATGENILIAGVQDSIGVLHPPNQIIYPAALVGEGVTADVRYTWRKNGFAQDVIIREVPPPEVYNIDPATARLQAWTFFLEAPEPQIEARALRTEEDQAKRQALAEPEFNDQTLRFGALHVSEGRAFELGLEGDSSRSIPVGKEWSRSETGDTYLIESIEYSAAKPALDTLQIDEARANQPKNQNVVKLSRAQLMAALSKPSLRGQSEKQTMQVAKLGTAARRGVVIDWEGLYGPPYTYNNFVFAADRTYYIDGQVTLSGVTTLEPAVIKFPPYDAYNPKQIKIAGSDGKIICLTTNHRPAFFVARDENLVGETVYGSTGNPSGYYAAYALNFEYPYGALSSSLHNIRIRSAHRGIYYASGTSHNLKHAQLVGCYIGIEGGSSVGHIRLQNVLVGAYQGFGGSSTFRAENLTFSGYTPGSASFFFTNSLLNFTQSYPYSGVNNFAVASSAFQTVGAGSKYLADNTYRNVGTIAIDPALLADLRKRTTYPPTLITTDFTTPKTLGPTTIADVDVPNLTDDVDAGYHYDILHYAWSERTLTSKLLLVNGVAIGHYGTRGTTLGNDGKFISEGSPLERNVIVSYLSVQENGTAWGTAGSTFGILGTSGSQAAPAPEVYLRFTDISLPPNLNPKRYLLEHANGNLPASLTLRDCDVTGAHLMISNSTPSTVAMLLGLTNNLFRRCDFTFRRDDAAGSDNALIEARLYNNLFLNSSLALRRNTPDGDPWRLHDNLFDGATLIVGTGTINKTHNGFLNSTGYTSGDGNQQITVRDYQSGPLGTNYYPTTGTGLNNLRHAGSRLASEAGLFHHTVKVDQSKAGVPPPDPVTVSIGYHYVAVTTSGTPLPIDTDGEGLFDVAEDINGDGAQNGIETSVTDPDSDDDLLNDYQEVVLITRDWINPISPDSDGDGRRDDKDDIDNDLISNAGELNIFGSNPTNAYSLNQASNGQSVTKDASFLCTAPTASQGGNSSARLDPAIQVSGSNLRLTLLGATGAFTYDIYTRYTLDLPAWMLYYKGALNQAIFLVPIPSAPQGYFSAGIANSRDSDRLSDGYECLISQTCIDVEDTDGDGIWDDWEIENGLNPNDASDRDGDIDADGAKNIDEFTNRTNSRGNSEAPGPSSRRTPFAISEIMYAPTGGDNYEFIEIYNSHPTAQDLSGFGLVGTGGNPVRHTFPGNSVVPPNGYLVIAKVPANIPASFNNVSGPYTGNLPDTSGTVTLTNKWGAVLLEAKYGNTAPWPAAAAAGHSLVLKRPSFGERNPTAWGPSDRIGGSPGTVDLLGSEPARAVVINEFMANDSTPANNFVELYNHANSAVDVSGYKISDGVNEYTFPGSSTIAMRNFTVVWQDGAGRPLLGFNLNAAGGKLQLKNPAGTRLVDAITYGPQETSVSSGLPRDGGMSVQELSSTTAGAVNPRVRIGDIVINEIMFNPVSGNPDDEYIEFYNRSTTQTYDVGLWSVTGFDDNSTFTIPSETSIAPGGFLVIARNFLALVTTSPVRYPALSASNCKGDYGPGKLANSGARIALYRDDDGVLIDEVTFDCGGRWGKWSDGGGSSLELIDYRSDNRLPSNWADSIETVEGTPDGTPKAPWTVISETAERYNAFPAITEFSSIEVILLGSGECLLDDVQFITSGGNQRVQNPTFEGDGVGTIPASWTVMGTHNTSRVTGTGHTGTRSLHVRAVGRGDNLPNRLWANLNTTPGVTGDATIAANVRWLRGRPQILIRTHGSSLEVVKDLSVPNNLGSPGLRNSVTAATPANVNVGPAIYDVSHSPVTPPEGRDVIVTARFADADTIAARRLFYRVDPDPFTFSFVNFGDLGQSGDAVASDSLYSARIPGQPAGKVVAFYIQSTDSPSVTSSYFPSDAPARELLVRFGDPSPAGTLGAYRLWMTTSVSNMWASRRKLDNGALDAALAYGNDRVIYNVGARYAGSPATSPSYDSPANLVCGYAFDFPPDDAFLGAIDVTLDWPIRDTTAIREPIAYWIADGMGLVNFYRRPLELIVNGVQMAQRDQWDQCGGALLFEDIQQPDRDTLNQWFPFAPSGHLHKTVQWYELPGDVDGPQEGSVKPSLNRFPALKGLKKAGYRWNFQKRVEEQPFDDYSPMLGIVGSITTWGTAWGPTVPDTVFVAQFKQGIDIEQWMCHAAFHDVLGNWDSFGHSVTFNQDGGKNSYIYKPKNSKWTLIPFDLDVGLGGCFTEWGNSPGNASQPLFPCLNEPNINHVYQMPEFRRAYWRAIRDAVNGPMLNTAIDPVVDARWNALVANNVKQNKDGDELVPPFAIKDYVAARRTYVQIQLNNAIPPTTAFAITSAGGSTAQNPVLVDGTAPVRVTTIKVSIGGGTANSYPVVWTAQTTWQIRVPFFLLGQNVALTLTAFDRFGVQVGTPQSVTFNSSGAAQATQVRINEWMADNANTAEPAYIADPADGKFSDWIEFYNPLNTPLDISGYHLRRQTVDMPPGITTFLIPSGTTIPPGGFLLVWADNDEGQNGEFGPGSDLHANFSNLRNGETLILTDSADTQVDSVVIENPVTANRSRVRFPDGQALQPAVSGTPTPRSVNIPP